MKLLKRMLLINWHYVNKQMIELDNINFLTGKNGAGKSTILDALQLVILGDTRGTYFNKAANEKTSRTLEGYLRGEIGDDGDVGYKYLRNDRFSSYIVCEFEDRMARKNFCIGVMFDVYKDSSIDTHFFSINGNIPENEFIDESNVPFSFQDLKSFLGRKNSKNFEFYSSNKQYQDAIRGKFGGLNPKFFGLFKKAVTFTPINDIEQFIVEYVCDVKNKIDITSMQENIRQYTELLKQVEGMKIREEELQEIENTNEKYQKEVQQEREYKFLVYRAEKQKQIDELERLNLQLKNNKSQKEKIDEETQKLKSQKDIVEKEYTDLIETRAKSDVEIKRKEITSKIENINGILDGINKQVTKTITSVRNHTLKWNANISELEKIRHKIVAKELEDLAKFEDLIKYLDNINENNFSELDITALSEAKEQVEKLIQLGNRIYFEIKRELEEDCEKRKNLEEDIQKLEKGINPYESTLIEFKEELERRLQERTNKNTQIHILADLLEIKDAKWQNAIEGYLNTQKQYLIIEPQFFEEASNIYREMAKDNNRIHSFGLVDIAKIQNENNLAVYDNSLAREIDTENSLARVYIDYILGKVIKCNTIQELRNNKIAVTADCMLYHGYVLRKINPHFYKYPIIGKNALRKQKEIKEQELEAIKEKIEGERVILPIMTNLIQMSNFSDGDINNFSENIENSRKKQKHIQEKENLEKELEGMDMLWLNTITEKINEKSKEKVNLEKQIDNNNITVANLNSDIANIEKEKLPEVNSILQRKNIEIEENYSKEWVETTGEELYQKKSLNKIPEKIIETYGYMIKKIANQKEIVHTELLNKKANYNTKYQLAYKVLDDSNQDFIDELTKLKEITLPEYVDKIEDSRNKAYEQFKIEFLDKLKSNIDEVKSQIKELNYALSEHRFGKDSYSFKVTARQEYKRFYDMLQDDLLLGDWGIGQEQFSQKYTTEINELFEKITTTESTLISREEIERNIKMYTDYRTYLNFDLIVKDQNGNEQRLSKTLLKKSGGETQTPFYISILASFAQVYRINRQENTIRLIVFDEAFSKMDSERIEESIKLLKKIGFQAIFAAPLEKLQDIFEWVDSALVVDNNNKSNQIVVRKYTKKDNLEGIA